MTSANVTNFIIRDAQGKQVGELSQHAYCKTKWGELLKYQPPDQFTIQATGLDEEEESWENDEILLEDFVNELKRNKTKFNTWADLRAKTS